jgi:hypothetical protein
VLANLIVDTSFAHKGNAQKVANNFATTRTPRIITIANNQCMHITKSNFDFNHYLVILTTCVEIFLFFNNIRLNLKMTSTQPQQGVVI